MKDFILFVDSETSGIPKNWDKPNSANWPYIIQLAWLVYTKEGELVKVEDHYIKDEGVEIEPVSQRIHGITKEVLSEKGKKRVKVFKLLFKDLRSYDPLIVGHLVEFDLKMLSVGFKRAGLKNILGNYPSFCTMKANAHYVRFSNHTYPKLNELYQTLFKEKMNEQHNALADAQATAACFFEQLKRSEISQNTIVQQQKPLKEKLHTKMKSGCGLPVLFAFTLLVVYFYLTL